MSVDIINKDYSVVYTHMIHSIDNSLFTLFIYLYNGGKSKPKLQYANFTIVHVRPKSDIIKYEAVKKIIIID